MANETIQAEEVKTQQVAAQVAEVKQADPAPKQEAKKEGGEEAFQKARAFMKNSLKLGHVEKALQAPEEGEKKKDEPKKEEPKKEEPVKAEEEPKKKAQPKQKRVEPIDAAEITRVATEAATKATMEATKRSPGQDEPKSEDDFGIPEDYAQDIPVLKELERLMPQKYAKISEKFVKSAKLANSYKTKWQKDHPGQEFDPNDSEHDEFYEKNEVQYDDKDFQKAMVSSEARKIVAESRDEEKKVIDELRSKTNAMEMAPAIEKAATLRVSDMISAAAPELKDIVSGGLTDESLQKLVEKDPIAGDIIAGAAANLREFTKTSILLMSAKAGVQFDKKNQMHQEVYEFLVETEREMQALPEEDQIFNGRKFVPRPAYIKAVEENPRKAELLWTFTADQLAEIRAGKAANFAKQAIAHRRATIEKQAIGMGFTKAAAAQSTQAKPAKEDENADINVKGKGPSGVGKTEISPVKTNAAPGQGSVQESFKSALRSGR